MLVRSERILLELQLLTGIYTDDVSYLVYKLLKDGSYFDDKKTPDEVKVDNVNKEVQEKIKQLGVKSFNDLLSNL